MKKTVQLVIVLISFLFIGNFAIGQTIDFTLRYNKTAEEYEVYALPDNSGLFFQGGGSQISLVVPASVSDFPVSVTPVNGGFWVDNSRIFAPAADPAHDFHSITTGGGASYFMTGGQEILLFKFKIPGEQHLSGIRIFDNSIDPDSSSPGMGGGDYRNFFVNVFNPSVNEWRSNYGNAPAATVNLNTRIFLAGAYDSNSGLMWDSLRMKKLIPLSQPFSNLGGFQHQGSETANSSVFEVVGEDAIVDWVLVELRDKNNPTKVIESRAGFVQRDGDVTDIDGVSSLAFNSSPDDYFVSIKHRNHLGCMSKSPDALNENTSLIDFTKDDTPTYKLTSQFAGEARDVAVDGTRMLWTGNYNSGSSIIYQGPQNDLSEVFFKILSHPANDDFHPVFIVKNTYDRADGNMDGQLIYQGDKADTDAVFLSFGRSLDNRGALHEQIPR